MSEIRVNSVKGVGASAAAITIDNTSGSASANLTAVNSVVMPNGGFLSNRNLVINGAMQVAQRGTSDTGSSGGYTTVDRFSHNVDSGVDIAQVDVASGTTPYTLGFRKALKFTNGDNTADTNDQQKINYKIESQDLACSGWDSVNSNSKVTLSFWVKSSVAQTFIVHIFADDADKVYAFEYSATTSWTKITHTISGASGLTFNNDNGTGLSIQWFLYMGTDKTDNSFTYNAWGSYSGSSRSRDMATNWQTTDDATFELTGIQLEVGSVATDFEHRSYAQELQLCKRYYTKWCEGNSKYVGNGLVSAATEVHAGISLPVSMRGTVAIDHTYGNDYWRIAGSMGGDKYIDGAWIVDNNQPNIFNIYTTPDTNLSSYVGDAGYVQGKNAASYMAFSSEL